MQKFTRRFLQVLAVACAVTAAMIAAVSVAELMLSPCSPIDIICLPFDSADMDAMYKELGAYVSSAIALALSAITFALVGLKN